jgi:hypothetical protein
VLDFDSPRLLTGLDVRRDPAGAVGALLERLEASQAARSVLSGVDVGWCLSSSAGLRKGSDGLYRRDDSALKCHLLVWLEEAVSDEELRAWAKQVNEELGVEFIDTQALVFNQPIYGPPRLLGLNDWLPQRSGTLERGAPSAPVGFFRHAAAQQASASPTINPHPPLPSGAVPTSRPALSEEGRIYYKAAWSSTLSQLSQRQPGSKRGNALYGAAARFAGLFQLARIEEALGSLESLMDSLVSLYTDRDRGRCERDVARGRLEGERNPPTSIPRRYLKAAENPSTLASKPAPAPTSLEAVRAHVWAVTNPERLKPGTGLHLAHGCGASKSTTKRGRLPEFIQANPNTLAVLVSKDRAAALQDAEALSALGAVAYVGRRRLEQPEGASLKAWRPRLIRDEEGKLTEAETCGRSEAGTGARFTCGTQDNPCHLRSRCLEGFGYAQRSLQVGKRIREGGVVVCTPQLLPQILKRHAKLSASDKASPLGLVWLDDCPQPSPTTVTLRTLRLEASRLGNDTERAALCELSGALEGLWKAEQARNSRTQEVEGSKVRAALAHLTGHEQELRNIAHKLGAPTALAPVVEWCLGGLDSLGTLVRGEEGLALEVFPRPLQVPSEAAVVVSSATADTALWEGYLGRSLIREHLQASAPPTAKGLHIAQKSFKFHHYRLSDNPEDFRGRIKPQVALIHPELESLAQQKGTTPEQLKVLFVAEKSLMASPLWPIVEQELTARYDSHAIHWRGIEQVGSNEFEGFDALIALATPLMNWGAFQRSQRAARTWRAVSELNTTALQTYHEEAMGLMEQAIGRLRIVCRPGEPLFVGSVSSIAPPTLAMLASPMKAQRAPGPRLGRKAAQWLDSWGIEALSVSLSNLAGAPDRATLKRAYEASQWPEWTVKFKGKRGRAQKWKAPSEAKLKEGAEQLLRRGGGGACSGFELKRVDADCQGVINVENSCLITTPTNFQHYSSPEPEPSKAHFARPKKRVEHKQPDTPPSPSGAVQRTEAPEQATKPERAQAPVPVIGFNLGYWFVGGQLPGGGLTLGTVTPLQALRLFNNLPHPHRLSMASTLMFYGRKCWSWLELSQALRISVPTLKALAGQQASATTLALSGGPAALQ